MRRLIGNIITSAFIALAVIGTGMAQAGAGTQGEFTGASDHITTGGVQIVKTSDGGAIVILDADFSLDGAPDPRVGFGKDGSYAEASDLGVLQNLAGVQVYFVPASVDVDNFNEVYIWCRKFSVPLGVAALH